MVFSSLEFLFLYFPATLILYFLTPKKYRIITLFVVSVFFYGWGEPVYVILMAGTIAVDYIAGLLVDKFKGTPRAKIVLIIAVIINLGILGFFKYYNFFAANISLIPFMPNLPLIDIDLPIGISFYTFQALSYVIDVYRGDGNVQRNPVAFGTYVTLFPQLIAGPIVRYKDVDDQFRSREESIDKFAAGIRTFTAGLGKKVLFANTAGALWTEIQKLPAENMSAVTAWIGIIAFTFQIYYDFSGYSDMAIGLGKMFGFTFLENFNYPYISKSITEFWRRWHMSLGTWFREYVYIPLGGNRKGLLKQYRNIAIVWFLTGFWHGASWNYLIWGVYFGIILMLEKGFLLKILEKAPAAVSHIYSLALIVFGWLIFTFEDIPSGLNHLGMMFGANGTPIINQAAIYDLVRYLPFMIAAGIGCTPLPKKILSRLNEKASAVQYTLPAALAAVLILCTAFLVDSTFNPFLYFRF